MDGVINFIAFLTVPGILTPNNYIIMQSHAEWIASFIIYVPLGSLINNEGGCI